MLDQLMSVQLSIKSNGLYLIGDINTGRCPTIPSVLLFLLHIQREEVGGYTLANSMYKWSKMRSVHGPCRSTDHGCTVPYSIFVAVLVMNCLSVL